MGRASLHVAASVFPEMPVIIETLVEYGAKVNLQDKVRIRFLLSLRINIYHITLVGCTYMHVLMSCRPLVLMLIV